MINMIGDTVGQLAEQRFLFTHVPALLKGTKGIKASRNTKTYEQLVKEGAEKIEKQTKSSLDEALKAIKANSRDE
jgi:acetylglutamate kinase